MQKNNLYNDALQRRWYFYDGTSRIYLRRGLTGENARKSLEQFRRGKSLLQSEQCNMPHVYLWGAGKKLSSVYQAIDVTACKIDGIVDRDFSGKKDFCGYPIQSTEVLMRVAVDFIVITAVNWRPIQQRYVQMGGNPEKVVPFWDFSEDDPPFLNRTVEKQRMLCHKWKNRAENAPYEYASSSDVKILSAKMLLQKILEEHVSLTRFGDGEFSTILMERRPWFQDPEGELSRKLLDVLHRRQKGLLLAIADNYGSLEKYTETAADAIRSYQVERNHRARILLILEKERSYYDAYVTRPYLMYRDKSYCLQIFSLWKQIFSNRDILTVEGQYAMFGVGNDLLVNARSLRRILAPAKNAFEKYDQIKKAVLYHADADTLVLISLGPTATVLSADIASEGIQAIDIGQLDNEYDWYRMHADTQMQIPGKMTAEAYSGDAVYQAKDKEYMQSVVVCCF